jgi:hypothetical protein
MKERKAGSGYRFGQNRIKIVCYADDATLISESENYLHRMLHTFKIQAEKCNMKISTSKTKSMTIAKDQLRCKLVVDLASIDQIMFF